MSPRRNPYARYHARRVAERAARLARFAEHLAEGATIRQAQAVLGVSRNTADEYFRQMRADLGPQAI